MGMGDFFFIYGRGRERKRVNCGIIFFFVSESLKL